MVCESAVWEFIRNLLDKGLIFRLLAAKAEKTDAFMIEVDMRSNKTMRPTWIDEPAMAEDGRSPLFGGATQIDDLTVRTGLQVELKMSGEWTPRGRLLQAPGPVDRIAMQETVIAGTQGRQVIMVKTMPHLSDPKAVKALGDILKAVFAGRGKYRRHIQGQATANDTPDDIGMVMSTLKACVVVKLSVGWKPNLLPMGHQRIRGETGTDVLGGLRHDLASPQRAAAQHIDQGPPFDAKILDDIKMINLRPASGRFRQIPAGRWCRSSHSAPTIEQSATLQYTSYGANAERGAVWFNNQLVTDGLSPDKAKVSFLQQIPQLGHALFDCFGGSVSNVVSTMGSICPIHCGQRLIARPAHPMLNRRQRHLKPPCRVPKTHATADRSHEGAANVRIVFFMSKRIPSDRNPPSLK